MPTEETQISLKRVLVNPNEPPKPVHKFLWTRVGNDSMLDVGHIDLVDIRNLQLRKEKGEPVDPVPFYVTDRFMISPEVALQLLDSAQQLVDDLRKQGILPKDDSN